VCLSVKSTFFFFAENAWQVDFCLSSTEGQQRRSKNFPLAMKAKQMTLLS